MSNDKPHGSGSADPGDTSKRVGAEVVRERGVDPEELREKPLAVPESDLRIRACRQDELLDRRAAEGPPSGNARR